MHEPNAERAFANYLFHLIARSFVITGVGGQQLVVDKTVPVHGHRFSATALQVSDQAPGWPSQRMFEN